MIPKRTAEVLHDGWIKTGDLAASIEDGFLFIEGRLSRFSKIGGEMVPHETVEQRILAALRLDNEGDRVITVTSVIDERKGEALVLLSTLEIDQAQLRARLQEAGVPNCGSRSQFGGSSRFPSWRPANWICADAARSPRRSQTA